MGVAKKLFKFTAGSATGTVIGLAVGSVLAPQRGADLRRSTQDLIVEAKAEGEMSQERTEQELKERFRNRVNDSTALTGHDPRTRR